MIDNYLDPRVLAIEMLHSIRDTDVRLDELKSLVKLDDIQNEKRKSILKRIGRLIETRFQLIFSLMDVTKRNPRLVDSSNPFDYLEFEYKEIKRKITSHCGDVYK